MLLVSCFVECMSRTHSGVSAEGTLGLSCSIVSRPRSRMYSLSRVTVAGVLSVAGCLIAVPSAGTPKGIYSLLLQSMHRVDRAKRSD